MIARSVDRFNNGGLDSVWVFARDSVSSNSQIGAVQCNSNWLAAGQRIAQCKSSFDILMIADCRTYAEFDLAEMVAFHRGQGEMVTRAFADDGPVDLWIVDPARLVETDDIRNMLIASNSAQYELRGYVNRLRDAREFRKLVSDSFNSRCTLRPLGVEIRPGVWVGPDSEIGRGSRIVAPAFVGQGVKIGDDCLITRGTNVECNSEIDFGTAVEDSSVLANTYLGIGLDLSHSIVDGKYLWNQRHDVTLEITDPVVMRPIVANGNKNPWSEFQNDALSLSA